MISDSLTQGTKVARHALHPVTIVADAEVTLLEGAEPGIELQNTWLVVAEELSLDREPHLACSLCRFPNNLIEFGGEGVEDPCHHDAIQSSPKDGLIGDVGEDVVIEGVATKHEKHEVAPPLVVGRWGFQNDRNHWSYVLKADSLRMQVHGEGSVWVGASINGVIIIIILGDHDPICSGELPFQVTGEHLLLFPSEDSGVLTHPSLIQGLACVSHDGDESLLLSVHGRGGGLSHDRSIVLLPLSDSSLSLIDQEVGGVA
jgi:hypothetical protein